MRKVDQHMDLSEFKQRMRTTIPVDTSFENPGGGTSIILSYTEDNVRYKRGSSTISISFRDLFDGYAGAKSGRISTKDLRKANPSVFDPQARPAGHSCNCTFLFMVLLRLGLVTEIHGHGVRGDPFFVILK